MGSEMCIRDRHQTGRPVLVGTHSISESRALATQLLEASPDLHRHLQILNGLQSSDEADIVAAAGLSGAITIATNLAGRGTDIHVSDDVCVLGGLHVVVAECQLSGRMDRQLVGRAARQGNPGAAQMFVSADDVLLQQHGLWLAQALRREADMFGECSESFDSGLAIVQKAAETAHRNARLDLLKRETQD